MAHEFKLTRRIEFFETDLAGIVHFSNFYRMMESTEHAFFRSLQLANHGQLPGLVTGWPRVHATCNFLAPLRFEDEVDILLTVAELRTSSIRYTFQFRKTLDQTPVAHGEVVAVCAIVDRSTGHLQSQPIPPPIRNAIQAAITSSTSEILQVNPDDHQHQNHI